jgi:predicted RNA binding protein YcfA (HicA-like mRNA interferase family)/predicted XRE-type DNA-binding protein
VGTLPTLKPREVVALLQGLGFAEVRQKGSHKQFRHADGRGTTVPFHGGRDISPRCCGRLRRTSDSRPNNSSKATRVNEKVVHGTGNLFADLGFPDAAERQAKLRLAYALNQLLDGRKLAQAEAARVLRVSQPKVSALRNYKLAGFSVERLMNLLTALDQDVEIVIRKKPRSRKSARISVVAA